MLVLGLIVAAVGGVLITRATLRLAEANAHHRLPLFWGRFSVRPTKEDRTVRLWAQGCAVFGAWAVATALWDSEPKLAIIAAIATLIIPIAVPVVALTIPHNRRVHSLRRHA